MAIPLSFTQADLQAIIDGTFLRAEQAIVGVPFFGPFLKDQLVALDTAADANMPAIFAHVVQGEQLTADVIIDALSAYFPAAGLFLVGLKSYIDSLIQSQLKVVAARVQ